METNVTTDVEIGKLQYYLWKSDGNTVFLRVSNGVYSNNLLAITPNGTIERCDGVEMEGIKTDGEFKQVVVK